MAAADPLPVSPVAPMLAKSADAIPEEPGFLFEPKWDGFRALVFRTGGETLLQSRDLKPLNRWFPELEASLAAALPSGVVLDGEIVVVGRHGLDFDALQQRVHPAASRIAKLSKETPARFVAFDLLAAGGRSTMSLPLAERRARLESLLGSARSPLHLTPMTRSRDEALRWLAEFEGAGLDGVVAKPADLPYLPGKRAMFKIKHARTADCVVAGFRFWKDSDDAIGSLLLGLYGGGGGSDGSDGSDGDNGAGVLHHVGVTSSFTMQMRRELLAELEPLRLDAASGHPWIATQAGDAQRRPGAESRWSAGKDLTWQPLRPERVCEVRYDHLQGDRFRHATTFLRWRFDKPPEACRYDQLEVTTPFALAEVFGARG